MKNNTFIFFLILFSALSFLPINLGPFIPPHSLMAEETTDGEEEGIDNEDDEEKARKQDKRLEDDQSTFYNAANALYNTDEESSQYTTPNYSNLNIYGN